MSRAMCHVPCAMCHVPCARAAQDRRVRRLEKAAAAARHADEDDIAEGDAQPERGFIFNLFSGRADGGPPRDWIESEGGVRKISVRCVFRLPSDEHGSSAFAVGTLRKIGKKTRSADAIAPLHLIPGPGPAVETSCPCAPCVCVRACVRACVCACMRVCRRACSCAAP